MKVKKQKKNQQLVFIKMDAESAFDQYKNLLRVGFTTEQAFELTKEAVKKSYQII